MRDDGGEELVHDVACGGRGLVSCGLGEEEEEEEVPRSSAICMYSTLRLGFLALYGRVSVVCLFLFFGGHTGARSRGLQCA